MTLRYLLVLTFCAVAFSAFAAEPGSPPQSSAQGLASDVIDVAVPARDIPRGTVMTQADVTYMSIPAVRANASIVRATADLVGMEARRALRPGEMVRTTDIKRPTLVEKGSTVTMTFSVPGVTLVSSGRAMAEGGLNETITVLNPISYRQVQALVTGPGQVRVGPLETGPANIVASN